MILLDKGYIYFIMKNIHFKYNVKSVIWSPSSVKKNEHENSCLFPPLDEFQAILHKYKSSPNCIQIQCIHFLEVYTILWNKFVITRICKRRLEKNL